MPRLRDNGWAVDSGPAVDNGEVFQGSFYGCLYAFGNSPAPTPTPTPTTTMTPTPSPNATAKPTPTVSPTPSQNPSPTATTVQTTKNDETNIVLILTGNITASQVTDTVITTNQSAAKTIISFTVTGQSGNTGFSNITIAKSNVPYGTTPTIYVDGLVAQHQSFTQDSGYYYVWYTTHFSTHQISIVFFTHSQNLQFPLWAIGLLFVLAIPIIAFVVVLVRQGKKETKT